MSGKITNDYFTSYKKVKTLYLPATGKLNILLSRFLKATLQLDPKERFTIIDAYKHPAFQQEREAYESTLKHKEADLGHRSKKTDISLKSRHFSHKGSSLLGVRQTESLQNLKTQLPLDIKNNALGNAPLGKDFSDERKLVMQQMAANNEPNNGTSTSDSATNGSKSVHDTNLEMSESSSNAEIGKDIGNPPLSKPAVYSTAEIKPRTSSLQVANVPSFRTGSQSEEGINFAVNDKSCVAEEDSKTRAKSTVSSYGVSHHAPANYSFFPGHEETEFEQPRNSKVNITFKRKAKKKINKI